VKTTTKRILQLGFLLSILLYAVAFEQWFGTAALGFVLLVTLLPTHIEVDRVGQWIIAFVCLPAAYLFTVAIGPAPKHPFFEGAALLRAFFCFWIITYGLTRLFLKNAMGGHNVTLASLLLAVFSCGGQKMGWTYHLFVGATTIVGLWAASSGDESRPSLLQLSTGRRWLLGIAGSIALVGSLTFSIGIPPLYTTLYRNIDLTFLLRNRTGFDNYFELGALNGLLKSKRVVMRVYGKFQSTLYLRGAVYDRYLKRYWINPDKVKKRTVHTPPVDKTTSQLTIETVDIKEKRYFLPLNGHKFTSIHKFVSIDGVGLVTPPNTEGHGRFGFTLSKQPRALIPPRKSDLQLPKKMRAQLRQIAKKWTQKAHNFDDKLGALSVHFARDFRYSLSFERTPKVDPIIDFLTTHRQGHCEYFASAFALLARTLGIPTRVIGGYLVSEYNSFGNYYIVREQNAHSWVEVWHPKRGWITYDPTPPGGVSEHMPTQSTTFHGLFDLAQKWIDQLRERLAQMTLIEMIITIIAFLILWFGIRLLRSWRQKRQEHTQHEIDYETPLPVFVTLLETLQTSLHKPKSETLEHYANRLQHEESLPEAIRSAATLIQSYVSFRYGRATDTQELQREIHLWLQEHTSQNG
tara:strand:+ start:11291 stop:13189 length:1899 start_codon:yes stop_codon:yes gene_type:complete